MIKHVVIEYWECRAGHRHRTEQAAESCEAASKSAALGTAKLTQDEASSRRAQVLAMRMRGLTLQEIADHFGLSRERVRQMEAKAIRYNNKCAEEVPEDAKVLLSLPTRIKNILLCFGCRTDNDVRKLSDADLIGLPGAGQAFVMHIKSAFFDASDARREQ